MMGNHQKSWLYGRNAIVEALEAGRWLPHELIFSDQLTEEVARPMIDSASALQVSFEVVPHERITQLCNTRDHQGVIARMPPFPYFDVESVIKRASRPGLFLVLDRLQDPFNFGAVCRSAGVFGVDGVFVAEAGQADVNSQVARSSAGAVNRLRIAQTENLCDTIDRLKSSGVRTVATSPHAELRIDQLDGTVPLAVVIGNEGEGVSEDLQKRCDELVTIPQATGFESLNAAVSTGIVLYEIHRQRTSRPDITAGGERD
ncbi:MAG: 23S rRNA (guanosine(2251)-2'-O)-methyltransferase RlmB [Rhodopirellula sp.]|nr:23S rRNA (guanosine(2251)-2'-O)-methyltransferase RlmB [Rhodopirellula sp.]